MNIGSQVAVTFQNSKNEQITEATYGDTIQITATAQRKTANTLFRSAADNQVEFYLGSAAPEHKLGEATAIISGNTATATLSLSDVYKRQAMQEIRIIGHAVFMPPEQKKE